MNHRATKRCGLALDVAKRPSRPRSRRRGWCWALAALTIAASARGADVKKPKSAEASRLSTVAFRAGLRKRGLTELLELHLRDFPPSDRLTSLLMRRDLRLSEFADVSRPAVERRDAIAAANKILEEMIVEGARDRRHFQWRFDLAHSLIYDEAEPFFSSILYRGGSAQDRQALQSLTTRALAVVSDLVERISREYDRIDNLDIGAFEQLERTGGLEKLDALAPQADYLLLWALLYDSIGRTDDDPYRAEDLNRVLKLLAQNRALLETPHQQSKVQIQTLLLAGMAHRLINDHAVAADMLTRAISIAARITDASDQAAVRWAVTLAHLERIKNERDRGDFDRARRYLKTLGQYIAEAHQDEFGLLLVRALLERSVYRRQAELAARDQDSASEQRFRRLAWSALLRLQQAHPDRIDEINGTLYALLGRFADAETLDPFEVSAMISGLLADQGEDDASVDTRLDRAIELGEQFAAGAAPEARPLLPGVLYNVAVAMYRRDRPADAARQFVNVARTYPRFANARKAAVFAVQLASSFVQDPKLKALPEVNALYLEALKTLVEVFPDSEDAKYWRFFYAQHLQALGRFAEAAANFAAVSPDHERYLPSFLRRLQCMARLIEQKSSDEPAFAARTADEFSDLQREFARRIHEVLPAASGDDQKLMLQSLAARSRLLDAEVQVLPAVDRASVALERLTDFEQAFPQFAKLAARFWRVRLLAFERLGRLEEAARAIPAYIAADPEHAGAMLQTLFSSVQAESERLELAGDERAARRKAQVALILAQQVYQWSVDRPERSTDEQRRQLLEQLADANLSAGEYERAKVLYEQCGAKLETDVSGREPSHAGSEDTATRAPMNASIEQGYAEALYQLGQFGPALIKFNRLARSWPVDDPRRTQALLRDLQCRTRLNKPPQGIIQVIKQQRFLHPEIKASRFAEAFEKLIRENQRRMDGR
ncbi:MAG: hypothetical protein ACE5E5_07055 [Phycisphaerae bacterium]